MTATAETTARRAGLLSRFASFVAERHPVALRPAVTALDMDTGGQPIDESDAAAIDALRDPLRRILVQTLTDFLSPDVSAAQKLQGSVPETTPGVTVSERLHLAVNEVVDACDGFLRREAIAASLTPDEKREILRGMILTRATDNRLKQFFTGGEVRYGSASFQGKGFRSLGQEAIYAAAIRLRRGDDFASDDGWRGDVVSPMIRDLGVVLAMHNDRSTVRMVLSAQMGKAGPPMNGKDLHVGDWDRGILPAMAPLGSPALTIAGIAMAFRMRAAETVAVSFVGEGTTSLGEWHEAINACAARKLPAVFCVQNNQTALSTTIAEQSAVRVFADKAIGYGIPAITIDGTDPDAIAAAFTWAAERARDGHGPALIELVAMRMCGHAHHDDMLYLGKDPQPSWTYPPLSEGGYADRDLYEVWCRKDPMTTYAAKLGVDPEPLQREAEELVEREARAVIDAPWPNPAQAGEGVFANEPRRTHPPVIGEDPSPSAQLALTEEPPFDPKGKTFLEAVMLGVGDAL